MSVIPAPLDWIKFVSDLKLPPKVDRRLQLLMDRNTEGQLSAEETADLEALVELSETLSFARRKHCICLRRIQRDVFPGGNPATSLRACRVAMRVLPHARVAPRGHISCRTRFAAVVGRRITTRKPSLGLPALQPLQVRSGFRSGIRIPERSCDSSIRGRTFGRTIFVGAASRLCR